MCHYNALPSISLNPSRQYMSMRAFPHHSPLRGRRPRLGLPTVSWVGCIIPRILRLLGFGLGGSRFGLCCRFLRGRGILCGGGDILLGRTRGSITGFQGWRRLLGFGFVEEGWLAGPSFIGESSKLLYLRLADEVLLLFFDGRGLVSGVTEPLVPLSYAFQRVSHLMRLIVKGMMRACCGGRCAIFQESSDSRVTFTSA